MCPHHHSKSSGSQHQGGLVDLSEKINVEVAPLRGGDREPRANKLREKHHRRGNSIILPPSFQDTSKTRIRRGQRLSGFVCH